MVDVKARYKANLDGTFTQIEGPAPTVSIDDLTGAAQVTNFDGDKFLGGFGATQLQNIDYWTLRQRSSQLFNDNLYARGIIRRLITNEINTGLTPEAAPDESITGMSEESLNVWTEDVETRFGLWTKAPRACDWKRVSTFGAIQRSARAEALIAGDVLVVLRQLPATRLPSVQLISGDAVRTPLGGRPKLRNGHDIRHGVETDASGRVVAHWVQQKDFTSKRLPAFGEKTGRRMSWLVYGTDKRLDDVRGQPMLSIILQSLKEIDRYRDSTQRKAVINSILAMYIKKSQDKMSTLPVTGGAVRKDKAIVTDGDGAARNYQLAGQIPGLVMEELQHGEEPVAFGNQGTDTNFGTFEASIINAMAWANEIPPEILTLAFSNNYSASQAAINEFKIYLNKVWSEWGEQFCQPIYTEWLVSEALQQKIIAPQLLESWRDPQKFDIFGAWTATDWYGSIKPSTDMLKQVKGSNLLVEGGYSTRARESRITTGTKFSRNVKRLKRENEQLAEAMRPAMELEAEFAAQGAPVAAVKALNDASDVLVEITENLDHG